MESGAAEGPEWFRNALAQAPERGAIEVAGAPIETLAWGERGKPGLLLIHGGGAHADWWSFLAPFFADHWRVAAFSLSGMGGSGWRPAYTFDLYMAEAFAAAEAAGLFEADEPPVFVGHSFGGRTVLASAAGPRGDQIRCGVLLDTLITPPGLKIGRRPFDSHTVRVYPTGAAILERFRLLPYQPPADPSLAPLVAHIARTSIRRVETPEAGWSWRFDPNLWNLLEERSTIQDLRDARCPVAAIRGAKSVLTTPEVTAWFRQNAPAGTPMLAVPEAHHHMMLDQPLATVAALRGLLAGWPRGTQT